jgi:hypothetical protein
MAPLDRADDGRTVAHQRDTDAAAHIGRPTSRTTMARLATHAYLVITLGCCASRSPAAGPTGTPRRRTPRPRLKRDLLTLELVDVGSTVRRMGAQADRDEFDAPQQLMLDADRCAGSDCSRIGESERNAGLAGSAETLATVVVAL